MSRKANGLPLGKARELKEHGRGDNSRAKVLIIGPTPPPYMGPSVATREILRSALTEQFDLVHLDTADRRGLSNLGRPDLGNLFLALRHFIQFLLLLLVKRPQIVYLPISQNSFGFLRDCLFLLTAKLSGTKVIVHLRGSYFQDFYRQSNRLLRALIRWSLKDVSRAIVLSEELKFVFQGLVPEEKLAVVPNGVDPERFEPARSAAEDIAARKVSPRILYLGMLIRSKGFLDLLRAVPLVRACRPGARFTFAGELCQEEAGKEAQSFITQHNLEKVVNFVGVVAGAEKAELLRSADLFVFPPRAPEGQPWVILEAMATGLPIIGTDHGCIKETVGEGGLIVEDRNPEALSQAIINLLDDSALREKMGQANRERVLSEYTLEIMVRKLAEVFEQALGIDQSRGQRSKELSKSVS